MHVAPGTKGLNAAIVRSGKHPLTTRIRSAIDVPAAGGQYIRLLLNGLEKLAHRFCTLAKRTFRTCDPMRIDTYVHRHGSLAGLYWRNSSPLNGTTQYHLFIFSFSLFCLLLMRVLIFDLNRKHCHYIFCVGFVIRNSIIIKKYLKVFECDLCIADK